MTKVYSDNGSSMFSSTPYSAYTSTARRQEKREHRRISDFMSGFETSKKDLERNKQRADKEATRRSENAKYFNENIWARVQKEHPEMSKIKARAYARTKDPVGRQFNRLNEAGKSLGEIKKTLRLNGKGGSAGSTGHSGG